MFKVGDKVERIHPSTVKDMKVGNVYTVTHVYMDGEIELEGFFGTWLRKYFKLASTKEKNEI